MKKIIIISLLLSFALAGCTLFNSDRTQAIGIEAAKAKTADFINNNLMQPGTTATITDAIEEDGLYKVMVSLPTGQEITSYLSRDGKKFFPQVYDIAEIEKEMADRDNQQAATETQSLSDIPKRDKATAELFVMSFCPYGVQAEDAMAPVFDLFKDKADIQVRFIASLEGNDINQVQSLHGPIEGIEGARQLCVAKNYGTDVLWDYIAEINKNCYPIYQNGDDVYKTCWQNAARAAGANVATLDRCVTGEGPGLIRAEDEAAKGYGVSGSPTLLINGVKYNGARTPESYKQAVCAGFTTPPDECGQVLGTEGGSADGGC